MALVDLATKLVLLMKSVAPAVPVQMVPQGPPVVLCGDAADLQENLTDEVAPGYCWQDNEQLALASIRKLNDLARSEQAELWPNHDFAFFNSRPAFPAWRD